MNIVECPHVVPPYPAHLIEASRALLRATVQQFGGFSKVIVEVMMTRFPDLAEHLEGIAEELNVDADDLFLGCVSYDLAMAFGCSTLAIATADGPLIARNMDWFPEELIARASCIIDTVNGRQAGFVGNIGVITGLSHRGFALALNAVPTVEPKMDGYPMLLFLRRVLDEAQDFAHAARWIQREPLASGGLITLVGMRNEERMVIERSPTRAEVRRPIGDQPLITTNDYRLIDRMATECPRYARLAERVPSLSNRPTDESLLERLTDDRVRQGITAQHVIVQPSQNRMRLWVPANLMDVDSGD